MWLKLCCGLPCWEGIIEAEAVDLVEAASAAVASVVLAVAAVAVAEQEVPGNF